MSAITIISLGIATIIPIIALYIIYTRDLYSTGAFKIVMMCFIWGGAAFALASLINRTLIGTFGVDRLFVIRTIAPIEEEIFKGMILLFLVILYIFPVPDLVVLSSIANYPIPIMLLMPPAPMK